MDIPEIAFEHHFKVPVYRGKDFVVKFEEHLSGTFIHCDVFTYSRSVKAKMLRVWRLLRALHGGPIYALHDSKDRKHEKFLMLFGFERLQVLPDHQELWIWSNNGKPI